MHQYMLEHDLAYAALVAQKPALLKAAAARPNSLDTIPVVVHIIHTGTAIGSPGNPSNSFVEDMISSLNQAFSATYPGFPAEGSGGVNVGIYFKLAQTDPNCHLTNGIVRVDASSDLTYVNEGVSFFTSTGISHADLAAKSNWNNTKYLNIWLINHISNQFYYGYAYYPFFGQTVYDGIVLAADRVNGPYEITHEMGHVFDLRHVFEGSNGSTCPLNTDCNTQGDLVCDTPPVLGGTGSNPASINPCTGQPYGDVVFNYMSYGTHTVFTPMQRDRMRAALLTYRTSLLSSDTELPPPQAPALAIQSDDADNIICNDQAVNFTATVGGGATVSQYQWFKNNILVASTPSYLAVGLLNNDQITCTITAGAAPCYSSTSINSNTIAITVQQVEPVITRTGYLLSTPHITQHGYTWNLNGSPIAGANSHVYQPTVFGSYTVTETSGACTGASAAFIVSPINNQQPLVILYPNPFTTTVLAQTAAADIIISRLKIFAADGRLLSNTAVTDQNLVVQQAGSLAAGIYIFEFTTNRGRQVVKAIRLPGL